jgi:hypothetical protein
LVGEDPISQPLQRGYLIARPGTETSRRRQRDGRDSQKHISSRLAQVNLFGRFEFNKRGKVDLAAFVKSLMNRNAETG